MSAKRGPICAVGNNLFQMQGRNNQISCDKMIEIHAQYI